MTTEATPDQQREVLFDLYFKTHPGKHLPTVGERNAHLIQFQHFVNVGAFVDAALMLVPRGWIVTIHRTFDDDGCYFTIVELTDSFTVGRGCNPEEVVTVMERKGALTTFHDPTALALCAAIASIDAP